jgi:segregation and condensation protein B
MSSESTDPKGVNYTEEEVNLIEAVLFSSPEPIPLKDMKKVLKTRHKGGIGSIIDHLNERYEADNRSFRIRELAGGFQFYLLTEYASSVEKYFSVERERRLTPAGLETLAIIAYKQPITKGEIEQIRGVSSDGVVQTLLERKLIKPAGRADRIGKPLLYATATKFLEYFGIADMTQLPKLSEVLPRKEEDRGRQANLEFQEFADVAESTGVMTDAEIDENDSSDSDDESVD